MNHEKVQGKCFPNKENHSKIDHQINDKRYNIVQPSDTYRNRAFESTSRYLPLKGSLTMRGGVSSPMYQVIKTISNEFKVKFSRNVLNRMAQRDGSKLNEFESVSLSISVNKTYIRFENVFRCLSNNKMKPNQNNNLKIEFLTIDTWVPKVY